FTEAALPIISFQKAIAPHRRRPPVRRDRFLKRNDRESSFRKCLRNCQKRNERRRTAGPIPAGSYFQRHSLLWHGWGRVALRSAESPQDEQSCRSRNPEKLSRAVADS